MKTARGAETRAPGVRLLLHDGEGFIHHGLAADLVVELRPHGAGGLRPGGFVGHVIDDHAASKAFLEGDFILFRGPLPFVGGGFLGGRLRMEVAFSTRALVCGSSLRNHGSLTSIGPTQSI